MMKTFSNETNIQNHGDLNGDKTQAWMGGKLHPGGKTQTNQKNILPSLFSLMAVYENNVKWTWQLRQQLHLCPRQLTSPPTSPPPPKRNFPLTEPHRHNRWRLNEPTQIFWFYRFICGFWNNRFQSTKSCPHPITPSNYFPASAHLSMFVCSVPTCLQTRRSHHCFLQLHASPAYLSVNMSEHV